MKNEKTPEEILPTQSKHQVSLFLQNLIQTFFFRPKFTFWLCSLRVEKRIRATKWRATVQRKTRQIVPYTSHTPSFGKGMFLVVQFNQKLTFLFWQFLVFGFFQCVDAFLFVLTFLPFRFLLAGILFFVGIFKAFVR